MAAPGVPTFTYGLRGILCLEIRLRGPGADLHSGIFGGSVANPATVLSRIIAKLHDDSGHVAIPGFYDQVLPLERLGTGTLDQASVHRARLAGYHRCAATLGRGGLYIFGASLGAANCGSQRSWERLPRGGIKDHHTQQGHGQAFFSLGAKSRSTRFANGHHGIFGTPVSKFGGNGDPWPARGQTLSGETGFRIWKSCSKGTEQNVLTAHRLYPRGRERSNNPDFQRCSGIDTLFLGLALPDCKVHSPNENFAIENFHAGIRLNRHLMDQIAET